MSACILECRKNRCEVSKTLALTLVLITHSVFRCPAEDHHISVYHDAVPFASLIRMLAEVTVPQGILFNSAI